MAVQFTASAGGYYSTAGLPASALFTVTCWVYLVSTPGIALGSMWALDSSTSQYMFFGTAGTSPVALFLDWQGSGSTNTQGPIISLGTWYKTAVAINGVNAKLYVTSAGSPLSMYTQAANFVLPSGTLKLWIADTVHNTYYLNFRLANFKMWHAELSLAELEQELQSYVPQRTANLTRWYPFVHPETVDYSGNGRTLSGGTTASLIPGPPIAWSRLRVPVIPWDPSTQVWYAFYDTTSGELLSTGTILPVPLPPGQAYKEYLGEQPDLSVYEWDTTARDFVLRSSLAQIDRVADLVSDASLTSAWASLSGADSTAMQNRIGQMLGPYRYRYSFQDVDLISRD